MEVGASLQPPPKITSSIRKNLLSVYERITLDYADGISLYTLRLPHKFELTSITIVRQNALGID